MDINPLVIIPTFWTRATGEGGSRGSSSSSDGAMTGELSSAATTGGSERRRSSSAASGAGGVVAPFSHPTALDDPRPSLADCLAALTRVQGLGRVVLMAITSEPAIELRADERVREIAAAFPQLNTFVFGQAEASSLYRRLEQLELAAMTEAFTLKSYGAVRNLGLAIASVLGSDAVVFLNDDEIVDQPDFLSKSIFGLGHAIHSGGYLFAKTGLITDMGGDYFDPPHSHWTDTFWRQGETFNKAVQIALRPPQLQRANFAYGGCLAIHREMYTKIAFDPWIMRGEDTDYVINARLHGGDVYVDDKWTVRHNRPASDSGPAARFRQNVYRFIYEHRKLEFAKSQVDLAQVTPQSLLPFPGEFIATSVGVRAFATGLLNAITGPDRKHYWHAAFEALGKANDYARENCVNYFALQRIWAHAMGKLWRDVALFTLFTGERSVDRSALTGSFKPIR